MTGYIGNSPTKSFNYIGNTPTGNFVILDSITTSATDTYALTSNSVAYFPASANHCIVSLNGVIQAPISSFTISGSNIVFASALTASDVIDFIQVLGDVLNIGTPSDNTVSLAKLTATGTKDATTFLRGDNTFGVPPLGGITMADQWRLTTAINGNHGDIIANLERNDTSGYGGIGTGMTESSGIFSFPSTGIYLITAQGYWFASGGGVDYMAINMKFTINNSSYITHSTSYESVNNASAYGSTFISSIFDVTDLANCKVKFNVETSSPSSRLAGSTSENLTAFTFIRLGDT